jgi:hypothetical protein
MSYDNVSTENERVCRASYMENVISSGEMLKASYLGMRNENGVELHCSLPH